MADSRNLEHKDLVIGLYVTKSAKDSNKRCEEVIVLELTRAKEGGWEPCIPTNFDYLEKNGHVKIHKEGRDKTFVANIIGFFLSLPFISATDVFYDSVIIPLCREAQADSKK